MEVICRQIESLADCVRYFVVDPDGTPLATYHIEVS